MLAPRGVELALALVSNATAMTPMLTMGATVSGRDHEGARRGCGSTR
jgi:hypothetical protein